MKKYRIKEQYHPCLKVRLFYPQVKNWLGWWTFLCEGSDEYSFAVSFETLEEAKEFVKKDIESRIQINDVRYHDYP